MALARASTSANSTASSVPGARSSLRTTSMMACTTWSTAFLSAANFTFSFKTNLSASKSWPVSSDCMLPLSTEAFCQLATLSWPGQSLQLPSPVEIFDEAVRLTPTGAYLYEQLKIDPGTHHFLDLHASSGADGLQHLSVPAHQNSLLTVALTVDGSGNACEFRSLFELLDHNRSRVRHFLASGKQDLLTDELGHHKTHGLIGDLVLGEVWRCIG